MRSVLRKLPPDLMARFQAVMSFGGKVRSSEYHLTNACNIRCKGCWFFEHEFDSATKEQKSLHELKAFIARERARGVNSALLIGGEPTLFPKRVAAYVEGMQNVTLSTNGLQAMPRDGFDEVSIGISLFGGGKLDDELRAIKPSGATFTGLFDTALGHYRNDPRAFFVFAITEDGLPYIRDTVAKIQDNGNTVSFNFYSKYGTGDPLRMANQQRLLGTALAVQDEFPATVLSTPYYIRTMITGKTHWGEFGYQVCPSISVGHPAHQDRIGNGNRVLPLFNAYAPDLKTINFCCTSGHCGDCRDSQAVFSWLLVNPDKFGESPEQMKTWIEIAESYWRQFKWTPYHRSSAAPAPAPASRGADEPALAS